MKTLTLFQQDTPTVSICKGHVGSRDFNRAFKAEGWTGGSWIARSELRHEWWIKLKHTWKKSEVGKKGATPVTVNDW